MPPKKSSGKKEATQPSKKEEPSKQEASSKKAAPSKAPKDSKKATKEETKEDTAPLKTNGSSVPDSPKKRKASASTQDAPPQKSARRSRSNPSPHVAPAKLLSYLLSKECAAVVRPKNEQDEPLSKRSYTTVVPLTPFEELLSALVLSRPISHALGQRSIRTLLNEPYEFRTPKAILDAGEETVHKAMWDAKTQHKAKTAEQIYGLAQTVDESYGGADLKGLKEKDDIRSELQGIKGIGGTGIEIFLRRVQGSWAEVYPFVDGRTKGSLEKFGLSGDADELVKVIEEAWSDIKGSVEDGKGDEEKKRLAFVRILERAVGADLEGKVDEVLEEAGKD